MAGGIIWRKWLMERTENSPVMDDMDDSIKSIKNSPTGNRTLVLGFRVRCPNH